MKYVVKIGFIMYIIIETQIDIVFAILIVNLFVKSLGSDYFCIIDQILRYFFSSFMFIYNF